MKIAPLQWERLMEGEKWWGAQAVSLNLPYEIRETSRGGIRIRWPRADWVPFDGTVEEAKIAAMADLEDRITRSMAPAWQAIETAPKDGSHFLAMCVDLVDEYDEDRLIQEAKREEYICIAYQIEWLGGIVQFPFTGGIVRNRQFTHWQPLPQPPATYRDSE